MDCFTPALQVPIKLSPAAAAVLPHASQEVLTQLEASFHQLQTSSPQVLVSATQLPRSSPATPAALPRLDLSGVRGAGAAEASRGEAGVGAGGLGKAGTVLPPPPKILSNLPFPTMTLRQPSSLVHPLGSVTSRASPSPKPDRHAYAALSARGPSPSNSAGQQQGGQKGTAGVAGTGAREQPSPQAWASMDGPAGDKVDSCGTQQIFPNSTSNYPLP